MTSALDQITDFPALVEYLRDELEWPIPEGVSLDEATYDVTPEEISLKTEVVGGGIEIKQLRPLNRAQPWGVFFLNLPNAKLPVTLVRNILGKLAVKKRASANKAQQAAFAKHDLLFIAATGSSADRRLAFAHFADDEVKGDAAILKVLGWDANDTPRRLGLTEASLKTKLHWPEDPTNANRWRKQWGEAFVHSDTRTVVRDSKAMAKALAALARRIRERAKELIAAQTDAGSLVQLHKAFKEALIHDLTPEGFADTYAQTIAYGLLSAAISRSSGALVQENVTDIVHPTSPFLKEMLATFIEAGGRRPGKANSGLDFDELGITEVVELLRTADMPAVLADFDRKNPDQDPVIHFYELFLKEYDAAQKVKRGVFYTPRPVVGFIVRSVDEVLRSEFGLEEGLGSTATWGDVMAANPEIRLPKGVKRDDYFVRILDPATGTGTFLVECVDLIHKTMVAKWKAAGNRDSDIRALWNDYVPRHLLPRLTGFELMMAPYAIAHVKLGLKLGDTGYKFRSDARAQIYLTNALEPAQDLDMQLAFMSEALAHEAQAANKAKEIAFTAVIGNPPYAGHSGNNHVKFIVDLVGDYSKYDPTLRGPGQGKWLQDDYVKFLRYAQFVVTRSHVGVIGMITNHRFLTNRTFRGLRKDWLNCFSVLNFLDLHGNITVQESAPSGTDENVFDIEQGVGISIISLNPSSAGRKVFIDDFWGKRSEKYRLLNKRKSNALGEKLSPAAPLYLFSVTGVSDRTAEYADWPSVVALMPDITGPNGNPQSGLATMHDAFAIGFSEDDLKEQIKAMVSTRTRSEAAQLFGAVCNPSQWNYSHAKAFLREPKNWLRKISSLAFSPMDNRFTVFDKHVAVHLRRKLSDHLYNRDNVAMVIGSAGQEVSGGEWDGVFCVDRILQLNFFRRNGSPTFPLYRYDVLELGGRRPNLAPAFTQRVAALTHLVWADFAETPKEASLGKALITKRHQSASFAPQRERGEPGKSFSPRDLFDYIYAILHSSTYRQSYADYLKSDFPRVPLPGNRNLFEALVLLGTELVTLHLLDAAALPILKDPKTVRLAGSGEARISHSPVFDPKLGRVSINATRWFETVPEIVWNFHVGGYQPAQKWLKDRAAKGGKKANSGRVLTDDDILHYRRMIVALTCTAELMPKIDQVIEKHGGWPGAFRGMIDRDTADAQAS